MYLSRELLMQCIETQNAHFRDSEEYQGLASFT